MNAIELAAAVFAFAAATAWTPGPNNMMLAASGANFGFLRSLPHQAGIVFGMGALLALCLAGFGAVVQAAPRLHVALQLAGAAWLLWLAWRIATARRAEARVQGRPLTFFEAAGFQFVNPKSWTMGVGAAGAFLDPAMPPLLASLVIVLAFLSASCIGIPAWVAFGIGIARVLDTDRRLRIFNVSMGLLLAGSVVFIVDLPL